MRRFNSKESNHFLTDLARRSLLEGQVPSCDGIAGNVDSCQCARCTFYASARQELMQLFGKAISEAEHGRVLCVWLCAALGMPVAEIAASLGWSESSVHRLHNRYLREGASALVGTRRDSMSETSLARHAKRGLAVRETARSAPSSTGRSGGTPRAQAPFSALVRRQARSLLIPA